MAEGSRPRSIPTTATVGPSTANPSVRAAASASIPATLWAPSTSMSGLRPTTSRRPGTLTFGTGLPDLRLMATEELARALVEGMELTGWQASAAAEVTSEVLGRRDEAVERLLRFAVGGPRSSTPPWFSSSPGFSCR